MAPFTRKVKLPPVFQFAVDVDGVPVLPDPQDPSVQIWHDYHGQECGYGFRSSGDYWLYFPHIAGYRIGRRGNQILAYPEPLSNRNRIQDIYRRIVLPIALHTRGTQVLHASAVLADHGVAAFCGMSETGKSTTAYALSQRGYQQWADDAVPFGITGGSVYALPFEFETRIDSVAETYLGNDSNIVKHHQKDAKAVPLSVLFVLQRMNDGGGREVRVQQLSESHAFRSVLLHAHFFNLTITELKKHMVSTYMKLTSLVPVFGVHFQPGFEKLPILLDQIEGIMRQRALWGPRLAG
jgi:hypothetical protein